MKKVIILPVAILLIIMIAINTSQSEESALNEIVSQENALNIVEEWNINVGGEILNTTVFNNELYLMTDDDEIAIINDNGSLRKKFRINTEEAKKAYSMIVNDKYVVFDSGDELVVVNHISEELMFELNLDSHTNGLYISNDNLFYTDAFKNAVICLNIPSQSIVWEFTNNGEESREYSVYGTSERFFIENSNTNKVFEFNASTLEIVGEFTNEIVGKASDGKYSYNVWDVDGIDDEDVLEVWRSWISNTIYPLPNGDYYKRRGSKLTIFNGSLDKTFEYDLPTESYYSLLVRDQIVIFNQETPLYIFDPKAKQIVWVDDYPENPNIPDVVDDSLILHYKDGYVRKISVSE